MSATGHPALEDIASAVKKTILVDHYQKHKKKNLPTTIISMIVC